MSCPAKQDLDCMYRGDFVPISFSFTDMNGGPVSIVGDTMWLTLKDIDDVDTDGDATAVLQKSMVMPDDENSAAGIGVFSLEKEDTEDLEPGKRYEYDIQWVSGGRPITVARGRVKIERDITQST